jgi:hypothetical protein
MIANLISIGKRERENDSHKKLMRKEESGTLRKM